MRFWKGLLMCKCNCATFKEHVQGIHFAPSAATANSTVRAEKKAEKKMESNHSAYKALKKNGIQPRSLKNAGEIQNADSLYEIQKGKLLNKEQQKTRKLVERVMDDTGVGKVIGSGV